VEHVLKRHLIVEGGGTLEGQEPRVFHHGGEEDAAETFGGADETLAIGPCRPFTFGLYSNGVGGVGGDGWVVRSHGEM
jgi:hypothetical protein